MGCHYLKNWKADKVKTFLKYKGWIFSHIKGDDEYWIIPGNYVKYVKVPNRNEVIILPTLQDMVRKTGICRKEWIEWGENN